MRASANVIAGAIILLAAIAPECLAQHGGDTWIGRTSTAGGRQLKVASDVGGFNPSPETNLVVLPPTTPGGFFNGWSSDSPGFDRVTVSNPAGDSYPLETGANIWLDVIAIDAGLEIVDTPSYNIYDTPGETLRLGSEQLHKHVIWLLDADLEGFDPAQCVWSLTFRLRDTGATAYAPSPEYTVRFAMHVPIAGDFNCDRHVDLLDFDIFRACATGPSVAYDADALPPECTASVDPEGILAPDIDRDDDVDADDFAAWQRCYSGPAAFGDPNCAAG